MPIKIFTTFLNSLPLIFLNKYEPKKNEIIGISTLFNFINSKVPLKSIVTRVIAWNVAIIPYVKATLLLISILFLRELLKNHSKRAPPWFVMPWSKPINERMMFLLFAKFWEIICGENRLNIKVINKVIEIISIEILWIFSTAKYVPRIIKNQFY